MLPKDSAATEAQAKVAITFLARRILLHKNNKMREVLWKFVAALFAACSSAPGSQGKGVLELCTKHLVLSTVEKMQLPEGERQIIRSELVPVVSVAGCATGCAGG